jgi:uncharacterized protein YndB with AHSA1/START domain
MQKLQIKVALQIGKTVDTVFEAIVDPVQMSGYFISKGSDRMEAGKTVTWKFPEFEAEEPVRIGEIEPNKLIKFYWHIDGIEHAVEIHLEPREYNSTLVTIFEKERDHDPAGINWLKGNTEGWSNFLCCLKAYLEFGINLRKGGYDFLMKDGKPI